MQLPFFYCSYEILKVKFASWVRPGAQNSLGLSLSPASPFTGCLILGKLLIIFSNLTSVKWDTNNASRGGCYEDWMSWYTQNAEHIVSVRWMLAAITVGIAVDGHGCFLASGKVAGLLNQWGDCHKNHTTHGPTQPGDSQMPRSTGCSQNTWGAC